MNNKMTTFEVFDDGDWSVGLSGFDLKIHIENIESLKLDGEELKNFEKFFKQNLIKYFENYANGKLRCYTEAEIKQLTSNIE